MHPYLSRFTGRPSSRQTVVLGLAISCSARENERLLVDRRITISRVTAPWSPLHTRPTERVNKRPPYGAPSVAATEAPDVSGTANIAETGCRRMPRRRQPLDQPVAFRNPLIVRVLGLQIIDFGDAPNVIVLFD
jgi:hypothetical protein